MGSIIVINPNPYPDMVCTKTPINTSFENLKAEALTHLTSSKNQIAAPNRVLIIDPENESKWKSIPILEDMHLDFVNSIHYALRTGIHQNYSLFGLSAELPETSREDFEKLIKARSTSPVLVFELSEVINTSKEQFEFLLDQLDSENRIHYAVAQIEKTRRDLNLSNPFGTELDQRDKPIWTEGSLQEFLRSHIQSREQQPEKILEKAIKIIRSE